MRLADVCDAIVSVGGGAAFLAQYGKLFLVITDSESLGDVAAFVITSTRRGHEIGLGSRAQNLEICPIESRADRANPAKITVGRDAGCDITIPHSGISKLHAYFSTHGGLISLSDARSKNGTLLNDIRLAPYQATPVDSGDTIQFGPVVAALWAGSDVLAAVDRAGSGKII